LQRRCALAEVRQHAAELEDAARTMQLADHHLRAKMDAYRIEAIQSRRELMKELESLQDELDEARAQLAPVAEEQQETTTLREQVESLTARLAESEDEADQLRSEIEEKEKDLSEVRSLHEQTSKQHAEEIQRFQSQVATLAALRDHLNRQHAEMSRHRRDAVEQLAPTKAEAIELRAALARANAELARERERYERDAANRAVQFRALEAEAAAITSRRDDLHRQNVELARRFDEANAHAERAQAETATVRTSLERATAETATQRQRAEAAERLAEQWDQDLRKRQRDLEVVQRAHRDTHLVAASESRSLQAERARRMAAEQRVAQLLLELEALAQKRRLEENEQALPSSLDRQLALLLAENREVRSHRDEIDAEREHLAARLLDWMSPGKYRDHAAAADYKPERDPLVLLKREELLIEHRHYLWQKEHGIKRQARELDLEQTLMEQAYAAAMSARWRLIHKMHAQLKGDRKSLEWVVIGIQLQPKGESYLEKLTRGNIARIERDMRTGP
jgi:hypothetical protein